MTPQDFRRRPGHSGWIANAIKGGKDMADGVAEGFREGPPLVAPGVSSKGAEDTRRDYVGLYVPAEHLADWESGAWPAKGSAA